MESFIDPTDFDNVKILKDIIPKQWFEFKSVNKLYGISPVSGGGSAQAEFEILCGAPSILENLIEWVKGIQAVFQIILKSMVTKL